MKKIIACLLIALQMSSTYSHPPLMHKLSFIDQQIGKNPLQQELLIQRGSLNAQLGKYKEAQADFNRAMKLGDPKLVMFDYALLLYRNNKLVQAKSFFKNYLNQFPNHLPSLMYLAKVHIDMGDHSSAMDSYNYMLEVNSYINPGHFLLVANLIMEVSSNISDALRIIDKGNAKFGVTPQLQNFAIKLELKREFYNRAIERHLLLAPVVQNNPRWQLRMAELMILVKRYDEASYYIENTGRILESSKTTPIKHEWLLKMKQLKTEL